MKNFFILLSVMILVMGFHGPLVPQERLPDLLINEFLASNSKTNLSPDYKEYADWLEIYNAGNATVDIGGFYLTDDLAEPQKWRIPVNTRISPGGYLLFWADDHDAGLHTNFKLAPEGEQIGLFYYDGRLLDSIRYPNQKADISMGRYPNGTDQWFFFTAPTPALSNIDSGVIGQCRDVRFALSGGFYQERQSIALYSEHPDEIIHYTLDGSLPGERAPVYSKPLLIDTTTVVRARTVRPGYLNGRVITHTYFIDENTTLPVVSIATDPANLWDDKIGIYVIGTNGISGYCSKAPRNWNQQWERPASLEMYEADGSFAFKLDAGMQIGGGCTRLYPQKSLAIYTRSIYGFAKIDYPIFPDKSITRFNNILLRNNGQDWWRAMCRDGVMHTLVKDQMDIDWLAYKPAILFLNGVYWGIHDIREKHNEHYLASNYGIDADEIDILSNNATVEQGTAKLYQDMIRFIDTHAMTSKENYDWVKTQMDINEYINYEISEIYFANIDWPAGNIKYWRQHGENHKWRWILFDTDLGFGAHNLGQYDSNTLANATATSSTYYANPAWSTFLLRKLLESSEFKNEFIQRFAGHLNVTFHPQRVIRIIDSLKSDIETEMPRHLRKWPQSTSFNNGWNYHIDVMKEFATKRPGQVINHITGKFGLRGSAQLAVNIDTPDRGAVYINGIRLLNDLVPFTYFKDIPIPIKARPEYGYRFSGWRGISTSSDDSITITLTSDASLTALFEPDETQIFFGLRFNEIMALNSRTLCDEYNEYDDWIELYNDSREAVDIGGMYLTDDLSKLDQWQIPTSSPHLTTISPGGFLLLWADNTPAQGIRHVNIKLSGDGEGIGLAKRRDGVLELVDQLVFGVQTKDVSYGRFPDGANTWEFFIEPSPGRPKTPSRILADRTKLPDRSRLDQNYPNPFNVSTVIAYHLQTESKVRLDIYDAVGRKVATLVNQRQIAGDHSLIFHAADLASGVYLMRLNTGDLVQSQKIVLLR